MMYRSFLFFLLSTAPISMISAQTSGGPTLQRFDLDSQDLATALRAASRIAGRDVMFPEDLVRGRRSRPLSGTYTVQAAVDALLAGTNLRSDVRSDVILISGQEKAQFDGQNLESDPITVTGSRIRGAPLASAVTVISQEAMRNAGTTILGDVMRAVPQNYNGGQNPGVGFSQGAGTNINVNAASSFNLRGLGSDATLTLLNGHRLAYNSTDQGIDISAIPFDAIDRIEIVSDGASALYGSDAVGGVVNVILKRAYEGLSTTARIGGSTQGGNQQQQFSAVSGKQWSDGGVVLTYDYEHDASITAKQRSYSRTLGEGTTLFPEMSHHGVMVTANQELSDIFDVSIDGLYSHRTSEKRGATTKGIPVLVSGLTYKPKIESFNIAPTLRAKLGGNWTAEASFLYGEDRSHIDTKTFTDGLVTRRVMGCYCNSTKSAELNLDGPLLRLPAGRARLAVGGGYRYNRLDYDLGAIGQAPIGIFQHSIDSYYGFGELFVPLVSSDMQLPFIHALSLTGAVRYERYPGIDSVATPKFGMIFSPSDQLDLKLSWGKSFKTPTLHQRFASTEVYLYKASRYTNDAGPKDTIFTVFGGNEGLTPERATSWSSTLDIHPTSLPDFRATISYFTIAYTSRAIEPMTSLGGVMNNPIYADLIVQNPSSAAQAELIGRADYGVTNLSGAPYDPDSVIAIIDDSFRNVAQQSAHGIDASVEHRIALGRAGTLLINGSATLLYSKRRLSARQPYMNLAGDLFNPARFRGRFNVTWKKDDLTLTPTMNYTSGSHDRRQVPNTEIAGQTSFDLTARLAPSLASGLFHGSDFSFTALNIFNSKPRAIRVNYPTDTPFDSTNYSVAGRYIGVSVRRHW